MADAREVAYPTSPDEHDTVLLNHMPLSWYQASDFHPIYQLYPDYLAVAGVWLLGGADAALQDDPSLLRVAVQGTVVGPGLAFAAATNYLL
jgi:hypothetical protein